MSVSSTLISGALMESVDGINRIKRVAIAFGDSVSGIGIVIALAAINRFIVLACHYRIAAASAKARRTLASVGSIRTKALIVVRLTRHPHPADDHASETALDEYPWKKDPSTYVLDNTGSEADYKRDLIRWFEHTYKEALSSA